nr:hypothetical protein Iba_chr11bCG10880 [Ipomoea batatas]
MNFSPIFIPSSSIYKVETVVRGIAVGREFAVYKAPGGGSGVVLQMQSDNSNCLHKAEVLSSVATMTTRKQQFSGGKQSSNSDWRRQLLPVALRCSNLTVEEEDFGSLGRRTPSATSLQAYVLFANAPAPALSVSSTKHCLPTLVLPAAGSGIVRDRRVEDSSVDSPSCQPIGHFYNERIPINYLGKYFSSCFSFLFRS